ncbi:MAG: hypothetical protein ACR2PQ_02295 [Myxococcota bacterium]
MTRQFDTQLVDASYTLGVDSILDQLEMELTASARARTARGEAEAESLEPPPAGD